MAKAVKCPICDGTGQVPSVDEVIFSDELDTCHGCEGRGWVEVAEADAVRNNWPAEWPRSGRIDDFTTWKAR